LTVNDPDMLTGHTPARGVNVAQRAQPTFLERTVDRLSGMRALLNHDEDGSLSIERFLLLLIHTSRSKAPAARSQKDLIKLARHRRRYLGTRCFAAGPLVGVATKLADLYSETATVCELVDFHRLDLSDQEVAAHMLVLWDVTDDADEARAVVDPARAGTIAGVVAGRARDKVASDASDSVTMLTAAKALWDFRGSVGDVRRHTKAQCVRGWLFAGRRTKQLIKRAKRQLGISEND
jgi:hypothetical protein